MISECGMVTTMFAPRLGGGRILVIFLEDVVVGVVVEGKAEAEGDDANMRAKMRARSRRFLTTISS